nr:PREDICTED: ovochymase-2 isoform X1 [Lepisosteus oculatus]
MDGALVIYCVLLSLFCPKTFTAFLPSEEGSKCGFSKVHQLLDQSSRIVGGNQSQYGAHPWLVSMKYKGSHFCGATILTDQWLVSAAHCFPTARKDFLKNIRVVAGEHDQTSLDAEEQSLMVKTAVIHEYYKHSNPMSYDIALVEVDGKITFGAHVQPICLPLPSELFTPGTSCLVSGWGRLRERGPLPTVVHEVELDLVEQDKCRFVIRTVRPRQKEFTVICAGPEKGGKDACQGDSGGPLVCPRNNGQWALIGVTSWGRGCGRSWDDNTMKPMTKRGSPGVFTDVVQFLPWLKKQLNERIQPNKKSTTKLCSSTDGILTSVEGQIHNPEKPNRFYENNQLCFWSVQVPAGKYILLEFSKFDVENDTLCSSDQLAVFAGTDKLIGKFCGSELPTPILISSSSATLKFTSDFTGSAAGFSVTYKAIDPDPLLASGCGTVAVLQAEGIVQSLHYPDLYNNNADCHWIIYAPENHVVKLEFQDFEVELSKECVYDSLRVFGDLGGREEIAILCGTTMPPPVLSYENVMVVQFATDDSNSYRGFRATLSFINVKDLHEGSLSESEEKLTEDYEISFPDIPFDACGIPHAPARFLFSRVIGGEEAAPHSWPWQVRLSLLDEHICGGAIIQPDWVLTAAHCVYGIEKKYSHLLVVVAGDHDISTTNPEEQKRPVKRIILHSSYNDSSLDYDVALLQLASSLVYNNYVRPVCLPNKTLEVEPSAFCTVSGWGGKIGGQWNSTLQQLEVPLLDASDCELLYPGRITERMFCAGFPHEEGHDTCLGDSGGPLVCHSEQSLQPSYFIYGITSWAFGCGKLSKPGVYTSVQVLREWILQQLSANMESTVRTETKPKTESSKKNTYLETNTTPEFSGEDVHFSSGCQNIILTESEGEIQSPGYPNNYPNDLSCQWRILVPQNHFVKVEFIEFNLSTDGERCTDFITVYDGMNQDKNFEAKFCGGIMPHPVWSSSTALTVHFHTNSIGTASGFKLEYRLYDLSQG